MIELLAAHAAIAITNARLYERSRELSILAERNRLALELHDAVSQKLFSLVLDRRGRRHAARARPGGGARAGRRGCRRSAREALEELRSLIFELRPPELERDGLCGALRKHVEVLRRLAARGDRARRSTTSCRRTRRATARSCGSPRRRSRTRSATPGASTSACGSTPATGGCVLEVADDGVGFDPGRRRSCARGGSG